MRFFNIVIVILVFALPHNSLGQDIELFQQFNGRYDYTAIGNTLNPFENNLDFSFCEPLESSSADLNLAGDNTIIAAFLFWAGSGSEDTSVDLNGTTFDAQGYFGVDYENEDHGTLEYFACYTDITNFVIAQGNTTYEVSNIDISEALNGNIGYCDDRTNFAGWSIYIIYENDNLPLNQINLYQGLQIINDNDQEMTITIDNLNVIDNVGAKIGFLAWEGDNQLNFGERLSFNGNILSNPPLNLANNAFNGTNTFANTNTFYNGDLDVYDIQDNISIGDTSATIQMTTGITLPNGEIRADLIILNNIITVLNSQLPDATITLDNYNIDCANTSLTLNYTVFNTNSTAPIPANTSIAFYANDVLFHLDSTQNEIPINGFESHSITVPIPSNATDITSITLIVDSDANGIGNLNETNETNNTFEDHIDLQVISPIQILPSTIKCNIGFESAFFDLTGSLTLDNVSDAVQFYPSLSDLESNTNEILIPENYSNTSNPQTIYAKVGDIPCYDVYAFDILVENCPPTIPQGFSPNNDNSNDWFNIQGLYNIFENHELKIFNRYGTLIFEGNNDKPWHGRTNRGLNNIGNLVPVGTYFYILNLNDSNYDLEMGWVYVNY